MSRLDLACLLVGAALIVLGVALVYVPAAVILAGVALVGSALMRDVPATDDKEQRR